MSKNYLKSNWKLKDRMDISAILKVNLERQTLLQMLFKLENNLLMVGFKHH